MVLKETKDYFSRINKKNNIHWSYLQANKTLQYGNSHILFFFSQNYFIIFTKLFYASSCLLIDKKFIKKMMKWWWSKIRYTERQYWATLSFSVCIRHVLMFNSIHIIEETSYINTWFCNQRLNCKVVFIFSYISITLEDKKVIYVHLKIKQIPAISYKTMLKVH